MQVNILLPDDGNFDCVVLVDVDHGDVVLMVVMLNPPLYMVSLLMVVSLLLILVPPLVVTDWLG